ncbi:unnamed protein product [Brassica oleracea var. botrytis]
MGCILRLLLNRNGALLDEMAVVATEEYRSVVFQEPRVLPPGHTGARVWSYEHRKQTFEEETKWRHRISLCDSVDLCMDSNEIPSPCMAWIRSSDQARG